MENGRYHHEPCPSDLWTSIQVKITDGLSDCTDSKPLKRMITREGQYTLHFFISRSVVHSINGDLSPLLSRHPLPLSLFLLCSLFLRNHHRRRRRPLRLRLPLNGSYSQNRLPNLAPPSPHCYRLCSSGFGFRSIWSASSFSTTVPDVATEALS